MTADRWPLPDLLAYLRGLHSLAGNEAADRLEAAVEETTQLRADLEALKAISGRSGVA